MRLGTDRRAARRRSDGLLLKKPEYRWIGNLGAKRIQDTRQLWVVAAGQQDSTADPPIEQHDLTTNLALGPMNLGDAENVVVVTACEDCRGRTMPNPGPRLVAGVNYSSSGLVHVATPGEEIPSPASQFQYGATSGTSAATAFVAGLASAMMTKYPGAYDPASLKARLQYTATPWIADPSVVASGVVNAKTAMLDPQTRLPEWRAGRARLVVRRRHGTFRIDDARRQLQRGRERAHPDAAGSADLRDAAHQRRPVIKLKSQKVITLDAIHDLLVREGRLAVRPAR